MHNFFKEICTYFLCQLWNWFVTYAIFYNYHDQLASTRASAHNCFGLTLERWWNSKLCWIYVAQLRLAQKCSGFSGGSGSRGSSSGSGGGSGGGMQQQPAAAPAVAATAAARLWMYFCHSYSVLEITLCSQRCDYSQKVRTLSCAMS